MKIIRAIRHLDSGFTLIELLLAMAIAAIIGVSIFNMFWSAVKLDDRMRHVYEDYIELLMADQAMTHDLENAVSLDFSASYPDAVIFDGQKQEFSFITQTPGGLKRVHYFSGSSPAEKQQYFTGRVVNPHNTNTAGQEPPVEYLWREESSLADWLNETGNAPSAQIVARGLKKDSFSCQYAPGVKDLHKLGSKAIDYQDSWDQKGLPLVVSCSFVLTDSANVEQDLMFKKDIFLAPVESEKGAL